MFDRLFDSKTFSNALLAAAGVLILSIIVMMLYTGVFNQPQKLRLISATEAMQICAGGAAYRDDRKERSGTHAQYRCLDGSTIPAYK